MDRVFRAFDEDMDGYISMKDWCGGLSTFLRGSLEEKTKCKFSTENDKHIFKSHFLLDTFKVFDLNGDGYISREEMFQLLKNCLVKVRVRQNNYPFQFEMIFAEPLVN